MIYQKKKTVIKKGKENINSEKIIKIDVSDLKDDKYRVSQSIVRDYLP